MGDAEGMAADAEDGGEVTVRCVESGHGARGGAYSVRLPGGGPGARARTCGALRAAVFAARGHAPARQRLVCQGEVLRGDARTQLPREALSGAAAVHVVLRGPDEESPQAPALAQAAAGGGAGAGVAPLGPPRGLLQDQHWEVRRTRAQREAQRRILMLAGHTRALLRQPPAAPAPSALEGDGAESFGGDGAESFRGERSGADVALAFMLGFAGGPLFLLVLLFTGTGGLPPRPRAALAAGALTHLVAQAWRLALLRAEARERPLALEALAGLQEHAYLEESWEAESAFVPGEEAVTIGRLQ